jgi:hypothetical protein
MGLTKPRAAQIYNLDYKQSTRVVTVVNITLSAGAPSTVDGVSLSLNDRVLVTGQSTASQNGLYKVSTVGSGSNGTWARTSDANETGEIEAGMVVMVTEGTIYADTQWKLITDDPITVGTTALTFTQNYSANSISGGTSNVTVLTNANVTISSAGTANVLTVSSTGLVVAGNILPSANAVYNLGSPTAQWASVYVGNATLYLGITAISADNTSNTLLVNGNPVVTANASGTSNTTGNIQVIGNITASNVLTGGLISATGNVTGNYFLGNVACASGIFATKIFSGTTEANIVSANGNLAISVSGTSNVAVFATTGEYVTGLLSASGNATAGNVLTGGLISATGNITGNFINGNIYFANGFSASKIFNGNSEVNVVSSGGNVNVSVGGTSNVLVVATTGVLVTGLVSATGNVQAGNIQTVGLISATGNVQAGNIQTVGLISATGNVTGNNFIGNGSALTGINTFSQIFVTGATTVNATSLTSNVTFAGGANIDLTSNGNTITIAYTAAGTGSIFATGGDMGLIANPVTESEDLGNVIVVADTSYDLGTLFTTTTLNQLDMTGFTSNINTGNLNAVGLVSAAGNVTGNYILGNGSQLTGISSTLSGNLAGNLTGNGFGANAFSFVSATGNITGNNITAANTIGGVTSTALAALNITLQQNYGGF